MKVYDCFPFFNELDILEIRLEELWDTVDYFVLAESNLSHSGKPKEYIFENNKERFSKYLSKIRHIKVEDMPETNDSWVRERYQRFSLGKGLHDMTPNDIVIVSDCDEIARAEIVEMIKVDENNWDKYILYIPQYQYRLNYMKIFQQSKNANIMITRGRAFTNAQKEREFTFYWNPKPQDTVFVDHGGWHFTYLGDDNHAITKIQNFAHTETDTPDMIARHNIEWFINNKYGHHGPKDPERFEIVSVDDYFPKFITDNLDRWKNLIHPGAVFRTTDLYRE
jgi:hypothetical protein